MQNSRTPEERGKLAPARSRGRPRAFDREAALEQAMRLFWRKGFEATSMADLTAAMGIGAPSLYAAFASKEALYAETLSHYQEKFGQLAWEKFESATTARAAVEGLLLHSAAALTGCESGAPTGCMLTLSSIDSDSHATLCDSVRASRGVILERLETRFTRAVAAGEIAATTDLHALARFVQTVQNGMSIVARDGAARAELEAVARLAMASWDSTLAAAITRDDKSGR
jgi:AcrR family transcriptional regulator